MAVSSRSMTRQRDYSKLLIALAVLAGVVAIAPIVAAAAGLVGSSPRTRTAFASAPPGEYAVFGRSEGAADVISVAPADQPGRVTEVVRVSRLEGFPSSGAVSPDGRRLALVSVDGGTRTHPVASLKVVELESGKLTTAAKEIAPEQSPLWSPDGATVIFTRFAGTEPGAPVEVLRVRPDGSGEKRLAEYRDVLGAYPVGHDSTGALATVILDRRGSVLTVGGKETLLSPGLTRDWRLSPDGSEIAFIDVDTSAGTRYLARTVRLDGQDGAQAAALSVEVSALGTAWNPATRQPAFGLEPGQGAFSATRQALASDTSAAGAAVEPANGFDIPEAFSPSGDALVVTRWSGSTFADPGTPKLELVTPTGRTAYDTYTRFYGWSAR